jgi:NAD(P)H-flavin reductase
VDATEIYEGKHGVHILMDGRDNVTGETVKRVVVKKYAHSRLASFELTSMAVGIVSNYDTNLVINNIIAQGDRFIPVKLSDKQLVVFKGARSPVYKFTFEFPSNKWVMRVQPGDAVVLRMVVAGRAITRLYTPIVCENKGKIELLIKIYEYGMLTSALDKVPIGTELYLRGGVMLTHQASEHDFEKMGLIAGGTGIAPMLLMLDYYHPKPCEIVLVIVAHNMDEVIAQQQVAHHVSKFKDRLKVYYVLAEGDAKDHTFIGKLNESILKQTMPVNETVLNTRNGSLQPPKLGTPHSEKSEPRFDKVDMGILISGQTEFNDCVANMLLNLGYHRDHIITYTNHKSLYRAASVGSGKRSVVRSNLLTDA